MFEKRADYTLIDAQPLNAPDLSNSFFKDQNLSIDSNLVQETMQKIAAQKESSEKSGDGEDSPTFDLQAEIENHPDSLFIKCFAIKADETNDNGDYFSREELIKATPTFVGVPLFTNHANADINEARGKVVHSWWEDDKNGIMIVGRIDAAAYPQLARGVKEQYVMGCFPPDAPVLMNDGTEKHICDIEDGDYVISGKGHVRKVLGTRQRGWKHSILSVAIEGIKQPLKLTSYHNIFVYRPVETCVCGCGESLPVHKDGRITVQNFSRIFKQGHNRRGIKIESKYIHKIKAKDLQPNDFLIEPKYQSNEENSSIKNADEAFLVGLFLAEGSYEKRDGVRYSVIFNFGHTELETIADKCSDLLKKVFSEYRNKPTINWYPDASQTRVCLYGKEVADWFYKRCGEYSDKKQLNKDIHNHSNDILSSVMAGFIEGDGWNVKNKTYGLVTVSPNLCSQFRVILNNLGVRTRFRIRKSSGWGYKPVHELTFGTSTAKKIHEKLLFKKANVSSHPPAKWHSLENITLRKVKKIQEVDYDGLVYDIEVEEDHSYCVNHIAVSNTSMGCQVQYSLCSICHNYAETPDQYCSCIQERKTRQVTSRKQECKYHEQGGEKECPICQCKKGETKKYSVNSKVFEYNYGIKFIENSFVVNPACSECGVTEIIDPQSFLAKVADIQARLPRLLKAAGQEPLTCTDTQCIKIAGQEQLDSLNDALNLISSVSQDMLNQKEQIDLEFLSDLVEVLADLQTVTDELTEQGYGRLPSPGQPGQQGPGGEAPDMQQPNPPEVTNRAEPLNPTPGGGSKVHTGPAGQVGNVTSPFADKKMLNLEKLAQSLLLRSKKFNLPKFQLQEIKEKKDDTNIKIASVPVKNQINLPFQISKKSPNPD